MTDYERGYKDGMAGAALPNVIDNGDKIDGYSYAYKTDSNGAPHIHIDSVRNMLNKAADVQPVKHGRWIEQRHTPTNGYNYNIPYSTYVCSSCGLEIHNDEYSKYVRGTYTNCPVCTAKMDGEHYDINDK